MEKLYYQRVQGVRQSGALRERRWNSNCTSLSRMGILDKLRSIQWRFPKREEPTLPKSRMILAPENAAQADPENVESIAAPDDTLRTKIRRFTRYSVEGMGMHAHAFFSEEVSLYDVSVNGACIHTTKDLRIGGKYLINIRDGKRSPYIKCRAVWRREGISDVNAQQGYMAGLQFQGIAPDELVRLKDFMRTDGVPDEKRVSDDYEPSPLRFMIVSNKKATLKLPTMLNVRKISLGGMLIESDSALGLEGRYPVKLPLPRESAAITCQARIASVIPQSGSSKPRFDIGIEFLCMEDADKARLDSFIHSR
jgi:hypothetical protein